MTQTRRGLARTVAEAWAAIGVDHSPLLADIDRHQLSMWWRVPVGLVVGVIGAILGLLAIMVVVGVVWMAVAGPSQLQASVPMLQQFLKGGAAPDFADSLALLATLSTLNGTAAVIVIVLASLICGKSPVLSFTAASHWRWNQLFIGLGLGLLVLAPIVAFDVFRGGSEAKLPVLTLARGPVQGVVYVAVAVVTLIAAACAEEILFRGWFMRHSAGLLRLTWIFLPLNAVLFSAAHGEFDPNAFLDRFLAGLAFGYMALRLGGVEYSTGAHAANNLLIVLFLEPLTLVSPPPGPFDPITLLEGIAGLALSIGAVELALAWTPLRRLMGPIEPEPAELF